MKKEIIVLLASMLAGAATSAVGQVMSGSNPNPAYSGLQLWLNASAGVASGGDNTAVTAWTNLATSASAVNNALVTEGESAPTYIAASPMNSQPALSFNGTSSGMDIGNASGLMSGGTYTVFTVVRVASASPAWSWHSIQMILANEGNYAVNYVFAADPWDGPHGQYSLVYSLQNGNPGWQNLFPSGYVSGQLSDASQELVMNNSYILETSQSGTGPGQARLAVNGVQQGSAQLSAMSPGSVWNLGWHHNNPRYFAGHIAEVLVYQGVMSAADQRKINVYLAAKYAVSLPPAPATTPTFNPSSGTYPGAQTVTISSDAGATVFYTTNGTTPTNTSASGTSPLAVAISANVANLTIKAYATNTGYLDSAVSSAVYTTTASPIATWESLDSGSWTNVNNWLNGVVGEGPGTADFSKLTLSGGVQVTLDGTYSIGNLVFADVGAAHNWFLDYGSAGPLTLDAGTNMPVITVSNQSVTIGAASAFAPLGGTHGLIKAGAGTLLFTGPTAYTGPTVVNAGVLVLSNMANFSSTSITNNANVTLAGYGGGKYVGVRSLHGNGTWTVDGNGSSDFWNACAILGRSAATVSDNTGPINVINYGRLWLQLWDLTTVPTGPGCGINVGLDATLYLWGGNGVTATIGGLSGSGVVDFPDGSHGTNLTLAVGGGNATASFSGSIDNTANYPYYFGGPTYISLTKVGTGTQTLSGANTYSGATTVSSGTLLVDGSINNSSAVTVSGGILGGVGTITAPVTVPAGGTLAPGDGNIGTLNIAGSLTLAGNVLIEVNKADSPASDVVNVTGALAYGGTLTATNVGGSALQLGDEFPVFPAGGSGTMALAGSPGTGLAWSFNPVTGILSVVQGQAAPPTLGYTKNGSVLTFNWTGSFKLQSKTNSLTTGVWYDYPGGGVPPVAVTVNPANQSVFYRLLSQ